MIAQTAAEKLGGAEPNLKVPYYIIDGKVYYRSNDEMVGDGSVRSWMTESGKGTVKAMVDGQQYLAKAAARSDPSSPQCDQ